MINSLYLLFQIAFIFLIVRQIIIVLITSWTFYLADAPFRSTEKKVINDLLKNIDFPKETLIYDLGSGTGKAIFQLAEKTEAKFIGVERNKILYCYAQFLRIFNKNRNRINFENKDIKDINLTKTDLVYSYLSGKAYEKFGDKFAKEIKKGNKFVALRFKFNHPQFKLKKTIQSKYPIYIYQRI